MNWNIQPVLQAEWERVLKIYAAARVFMAQNGNPTQWGNDWPWPEVLLEDIRRGRLLGLYDGGDLRGAFVLIPGEDTTYQVIEGGSWRSDTPYATVHRLAGQGGGIFAAAMDYAKARYEHLRVDTHRDNRIMQHLAEKHGFSRRGIIYVEDGTPRIAYDWLRDGTESP